VEAKQHTGVAPINAQGASAGPLLVNRIILRRLALVMRPPEPAGVTATADFARALPGVICGKIPHNH